MSKNNLLRQYAEQLEALAVREGLEYYPVDFELVPPSFMTEVAVYGLPVRMPHWSFGVRYIYQLVQHRMGHSRLFEVVFPGNPGRAYLADNNSVEENTLVTAHVLGHADFAKNNLLFRHSADQVGNQFVEKAAAHAHQIAAAIERHGQQRVERVLDAALALEQHIDIDHDIHRPEYPEFVTVQGSPGTGANPFLERFQSLAGEERGVEFGETTRRAPAVPHPEHDLLWFIAKYAPEIEDWERDIFLAVREESFYFYPVFACQIMNEGWASFWHARLLREADFLPSDLYVQAIKTHSDVVRPHAGENQVALAINPYHVGFTIWECIAEKHGIEHARRIMAEEDDFGFIRNHLSEDLIEELRLFEYSASRSGKIVVKDSDFNAVREGILRDKFNFGAPRIYVSGIGPDAALELGHDHQGDGRGLDLKRARKVLEYIKAVWRRDVSLTTVDQQGNPVVVRADDD
jgi:stage V sporulation protein R